MSAFQGAEPSALGNLAAAMHQLSGSLSHATAEAYYLLETYGRYSDADRLGTRLSAVARTLASDATDLARRADLVARAESLVHLSGLPAFVVDAAWLEGRFALIAPMGLVDWDAAYRSWRDGPSAAELRRLDPAAVAAALAVSSPRAQTRLVEAYPELMGGLDGASPELRYAANRILLQRELERLRSDAQALDDELARLRAADSPDLWTQVRQDMARAELDDVNDKIDRYALWANENRQLLLFDPSGDGRVAEVFGDLATADHVGVIVPGITNDITNFGPPGGGGFRDGGADLAHAALRLDRSVATIAWLGYDTPDGADAILRTAAEAGHDDLVRFVDGLVAEGDRHVTVIGHSYGSLVAGMAAGDGIAADEVVFVGSPGTSLDHAGDANLPPGGEVWSGLASWDLIGVGVSLTGDNVFESSLSIPGRYLWDVVTTGDVAVEDLWHGTNPAHESFGAVEFTTDGATGHSQYFDPGTESLDNLARIVAGLTPQVTILSSEPEELAPGPFGEDWLGSGTGEVV
jgi:hypothetical protein